MAFDWGSAIGAVVSAYGANQNRSAAAAGGKQATNAANQSNALQQRMYDESVARQQPFYNSGVAALNQWNVLMGLPSTASSAAGATTQAPAGSTNGYYYLQAHPELQGTPWAKDEASLFQHFYKYGARDGAVWGPSASSQPANTAAQASPQAQQTALEALRNTPGYQFRMSEGNRGIEASAAARGGLASGATLKALTRFGQGTADQMYGDTLNRLSGAFGGAQTAASNAAGYGQNLANNVGNNLQNAATARANSTYQQNQATQQGLQDLSGFFGDWYGNRGYGSNYKGGG